MIRLKHKEHGYHNCYTDAEVKACEKLGWLREEVPAINAKNLTQEVKKDVIIDETAIEVPRTKRKYTKKAKK